MDVLMCSNKTKINKSFLYKKKKVFSQTWTPHLSYDDFLGSKKNKQIKPDSIYNYSINSE